MNKKIIISLCVMGVVAAVVVGGTTAYFSDTETSTGNTFTAGTIDISINDQNPWNESFTLDDMKPCYTDYINFRIDNDRSDPNPVNIFKLIKVTDENTGTVSEPECTEQDGVWNENTDPKCTWTEGCPDKNNLSDWIWYDLYVEVYDANNHRIWWQTIYVDGDQESINGVYANGHVFLGMIPMGGYMLVEQSYHLSPLTTNWAQGDKMEFSIEVKGEQLYGTAWLENKDESQGWKIIHGDSIQGILTYTVKHPTFDFSFTGKAPLASHDYFLVAGYDANTNADTLLGKGTTNVSGDITITGNVELGKDMKDVKVWLVPTENWNGSEVTWSPWPGCVANFLWETGLIWYEDTDL